MNEEGRARSPRGGARRNQSQYNLNRRTLFGTPSSSGQMSLLLGEGHPMTTRTERRVQPRPNA